MDQVTGAFMNLGAVGLILWWLTLKLIPQLQRERQEAIAVFREEMQAERITHQQALQQIISHCQEELKAILDSQT